MSENTMISKIRKIRELEAWIATAQEEIDGLKSEIKSEMGIRELLRAGEYTVRYQTVISTKLDTRALKAFFGEDDLAPFSRTTTTRRFSIA